MKVLIGIGAGLVVLAVVILAGFTEPEQKNGTYDAGTRLAHRTTTEPITPTTRSPAAELDFQVGEWADDYAYVIPDLLEATDGIAAAVDHDLDAVPARCLTLIGTAQDGRRYPGIPDPATDEHYQNALNLFVQAGNLCVKGDISGAGDLITEASEELELAADALR